MSEFLSQASPLWVFLGIAAVGFLFLLISLVFGEIFEHGDFDHDAGPGFLNSRTVSVFITTFGGIGAIGIQQGYGVFASSFVGLGAGLGLASLIYGFARFLHSQQASSTVGFAELVGRTAQVTVGIPSNGVGQVRCLVGESMVDKIAQSRDGSAIPHNTLVRIEEVVGEAVVVAPVSSSRPVSNATQA